LSITTLAEFCSHTHDYEFLVGRWNIDVGTDVRYLFSCL
jgi:hypothetical protein